LGGGPAALREGVLCGRTVFYVDGCGRPL